MKLGFKGVGWFGKNTPNFIGRKEHGQEVILDLDFDSCEQLGCYSERNSVHIYADNTIWLTKMHYNSRKEEYEEELFKDLTDNEEFKKALNSYLKEKPLYQSSQFPYSMLLEREFYVKQDIKLDSLEKVVSFAKRI